MTDKEKINAIEEEIRSLTKRIALRDETDSTLQAVYGGQIYILRKVLRFIDSLPEESVSEDLEKFAIQSANKIYPPEYETADDNWKQRAGYVKGCKEGSNWQKRQTINKACEWLLNNIRYYSTNALGAEYMCNDFRKAMEQ